MSAERDFIYILGTLQMEIDGIDSTADVILLYQEALLILITMRQG